MSEETLKDWRFIAVPVQFEGVGAVSVCGFLLQVAGKVDDRQCSKRTFLQGEKVTKQTSKTLLIV